MVEKDEGNGARSREYEHGDQKTPFEQFDDLMTKLLAVPKEELNEKLAEEKREKRAG